MPRRTPRSSRCALRSQYPNVTLLTDAHVQRLETSASGQVVTKVIVERAGQMEEYCGDIVVVSCGAANSARLLLMSASDQHPRGLANGSDLVGRNYMFHNAIALVALSLRENPTVFQKTLSINDFYLGAPDYEFPLGNIQMIGKSKGPMFHDDAPKFAPGFTLDQMAKHAVDFWLTGEDLPLPQNRVTLNARNEIQLHYEFTNQEPINRLRQKLQSMLEHLDMHPHLIPNTVYLGKHIPIAGVAIKSGTCRFGTDPKTSVLDVNCKAHELDNLYVVDTSFFPSIGAVNPSLTAIANALRVGDHLLATPHIISMAQRSEILTVYVAGVIQGVALVTFPAAGAVFTSPQRLRAVEHGIRRHVRAAGHHGGRFIACSARDCEPGWAPSAFICWDCWPTGWP